MCSALLVAWQLTNTSDCGGNSMHLVIFSLAWLALTFSGIHCISCSSILKRFWHRDRSQLWAARKSPPMMKLGLSFLALTATAALCMPFPIPALTSGCPKVGTGLPSTPSSRGVSYGWRHIWLTCCTFWYNGHPIINTEAPVSISTTPSVVIIIKQQLGDRRFVHLHHLASQIWMIRSKSAT